MAGRDDVLAQILSFSDEEYFTADYAVLAPRQFVLLGMDYSGIAISAPRWVLTGARQALPVILANRYSGKRDWQVSLDDNCILVGTSLVDGSVRFGSALLSEKELIGRGRIPKEPRGPMPSEDRLASAAAKLTRIDARKKLGIPWSTGTWAIGVIYYDWCSNIVVVNLKGKEEAKYPPAPPVYPEPSPLGAAALPNYLPTEKVSTPSGYGLNFIVDALQQQGKQRLIATGGFTVPVFSFNLPQQESRGQIEGKARGVFPMTVVVLALNWKVPLRFNFAVPVYGKELLVEGMSASGYFSIDVMNGADFQLKPGEYLCYVIMSGGIYGPRVFYVP